jgi:hypothetical protein
LKSASQVVAQALDLLRHKLTELEKADTAPLRDIRGALEPFTERVAEYAVAEVSSLLCQAVLVGCGKHHNVRIECVLHQPRAERSTGMAVSTNMMRLPWASCNACCNMCQRTTEDGRHSSFSVFCTSSGMNR